MLCIYDHLKAKKQAHKDQLLLFHQYNFSTASTLPLYSSITQDMVATINSGSGMLYPLYRWGNKLTCRHTGNKQIHAHEMVCNSEVTHIAIYKPSTVSTLPGFWMRSAFTTWNTSTMPSVLQHSVALMREQNTPHRLTVSLQDIYLCVCVCMAMCLMGVRVFRS